jgi:ATP-binding cassette subfamily B protein
MLLKHFRELIHQLPAGWRALRLVWQAAHLWTVLWAALLVAQGVVPAAQALLLRLLINHLAGAAEARPLALAPAAGIAALWLLSLLLSSTLSWVRTEQNERVQDQVYRLIHEHALRLDLAFFDRQESYDQLHRARVDAASQPLALLESLGSLVQNGLGFALLAAILLRYASWMPLLLLATCFPGLMLVARHILREHQWNQQHTSTERRVRYLDYMLTDRATAAEMRLFALGPYHRRAFEQVRFILRTGKLRLHRQGAAVELLAGTLAWMGSLFGLGWMLMRTLRGAAGLGDLLLCFQVFQLSQLQLRALLEGAGRIYRSLLFVENLEEFLNLRPALLPGHAEPAPLATRQSIRFEQVSFTYPGGTHPALQNFDLEIPAGQVAAIVGPNGAGKSTLIKLLCRFYDPTQGRILLDGVDLRTLNPDALHRQLAVLFQDPVHYHATVAENIGFGQVEALSDRVRLTKAIQAAGAQEPVERLPQGLDSMLGKFFGGQELSGGEWQRIALARAFFRHAPLVILDEPTSAMDSWAEQDWLRRFRTLTAGKTGLMITHRFTTAMHADVIHVLDHGLVIESGTHAELVALGGVYATSWAQQMRQIQTGEPLLSDLPDGITPNI